MLMACSLLVHTELLEEPQSVMAFQDSTTTFSCRGTGNIFWFVNGKRYDFRTTEEFIEGGVQLEAADRSEGEVVTQRITVQTSMAASNNYFMFSCAVVGTDNEIDRSQDANLTIIGEEEAMYICVCMGWPGGACTASSHMSYTLSQTHQSHNTTKAYTIN